jgi:SAM-dependent methyltransferase
MPVLPVPRFWNDRVRPRWRLLRRRRTRGAGRLECNLCGWSGGFLQRGDDPAERHCPRCKGANRHRLIAWYLAQAGLPAPGGRVLHVAPEPALGALLRAAAGGRYETCDLVRRDVDHRLDLQSEIVAEARFDLIVINHVLEHVPDDRAVLRNLRLMLRPGGVCLVTVPMRRAGALTDEDPRVRDPAERCRRFGQEDHLRLYGPDLLDRMEAAGLDCTMVASSDAEPAEVARHSMGGETLFLGRRPL